MTIPLSTLRTEAEEGAEALERLSAQLFYLPRYQTIGTRLSDLAQEAAVLLRIVADGAENPEAGPDPEVRWLVARLRTLLADLPRLITCAANCRPALAIPLKQLAGQVRPVLAALEPPPAPSAWLPLEFDTREEARGDR